MKVCPLCGGAYPVEEGFCPMDGKRLRTIVASVTMPGEIADAAQDAFVQGLLGQVLDRRYRLDAVIGEGGMGVVFRATHVLIGKQFAVKVLRREHLDSPEVLQRFLLEARVASSLKHPNVVDIIDFGELPTGGAYYAMELLEGRSLAQAIDNDGAFPPLAAGMIAIQITQGLAAAHAQGVVHRDLKPDNVFLCTPRRGETHPSAKLVDFGIARVGPRRITVMGAVLGTPEYMSPEMAMGLDVDARADLYALGVLLFEMLTGTVPFYHREVAQTLEMHLRAPRPTLASRKPELARLVRTGELVESLLSIEPSQRPANADVALRHLAAALHHDLDRDAAEVVQRATVAIGSNQLTDLSDDRELRLGAPAVRRAPAPVEVAAVDPGPRAPSSPGQGGARSGTGRAIAAAAITACVAAVATVTIAYAVRGRSTDTVAVQESAAAAAAVDTAVLAAPAASPATLPEPAVAARPGPPAPAPATSSPQLGANAPAASVIEPVASGTPKPSDGLERSKTRKRKGVEAPAQPTTTPSAAPPTDPVPVSKPTASPTNPTQPPPKPSGPRDLKDPFPSK
ncbi:MAG: protein kinase [Nannocystaceae bacterium]|nr:protein kinase [Nannocystaceae bacterium]